MAALKRDLLETRERGYSLNHGENEEDACCVGTPIFDHDGHVLAAISLSAPGRRLYRALENGASAAVMQTAARISLHLGYQADKIPAGA
jgi:DNA-binding IclR family transcriptional regulator